MSVQSFIETLLPWQGAMAAANLEGVPKCTFDFTLEGASEWLRCKALRMRAQGVY